MKLKKLNQAGFTHWIAMGLFALIFASVGYRVLTASHAATPASVASSIASPTGLQLNDASTTEASLKWAPSATAGVTYSILRNGTKVGSTDDFTTNYLDTGLSPNTTYSYTITAQVGKNVSSPSPALNVSTGATTTPITSCNSTTTSSGGNYVLTGNITFTETAGLPCINFNN